VPFISAVMKMFVVIISYRIEGAVMGRCFKIQH